jgi:hypothetical protein
MRRSGLVLAMLVPVLLAACVEATPATEPNREGLLEGTPIALDGRTLVAQQMRDWPAMIAPVDASGRTVIVQSGTADTVVISGSRDSRDRAIRALAAFCGRSIDPMGFDTQFVYQEPKSGDWWFDGFCG